MPLLFLHLCPLRELDEPRGELEDLRDVISETSVTPAQVLGQVPVLVNSKGCEPYFLLSLLFIY